MHSEIFRGDVSLSSIYYEMHQKLRWTEEYTHEWICDRANIAKYQSDGYKDISYNSFITFFTFENFHNMKLGEEQTEIMRHSLSSIQGELYGWHACNRRRERVKINALSAFWLKMAGGLTTSVPPSPWATHTEVIMSRKVLGQEEPSKPSADGAGQWGGVLAGAAARDSRESWLKKNFFFNLQVVKTFKCLLVVNAQMTWPPRVRGRWLSFHLWHGPWLLSGLFSKPRGRSPMKGFAASLRSQHRAHTWTAASHKSRLGGKKKTFRFPVEICKTAATR